MISTQGYREHFRGSEQEEAAIDELHERIQPSYTLGEIQEVEDMLTRGGAFILRPYESGMLPAAGLGHGIATDYHQAWLRDQMIVAEVEFASSTGDPYIAARAVQGAMRQSHSQRRRFEALIHNPDLKHNQNDRPHIRWDGINETELDELWGHAQNDALGHFLNAYETGVNRGLVVPTDADIVQLGYYPRYLEAIDYANDEDHGCWEERPKVNNSSISVAMDGLKALVRTMKTLNTDSIAIPASDGRMSIDRIETLIDKGQQELDRTLPYECVQPDKWREADAALLVPVWTGAIKGEQADMVLENVLSELQGDIGIKRYHNDEYWGENRPDAQWCLFDTMVSSIYGRKYVESNRTNPRYLELQTQYLNRALRQVTTNPADPSMYAMPEMYYVAGYHSDGTPDYQTNPNTPLLWAAANLRMAFHDMKQSLTNTL